MDLRGEPPTASRSLGSGTTTIGLVCEEGVVLATERRATRGHVIANKSTVKLFRTDRAIGATFAGSIGDAQAMIRYLQSEVALYRLRRGAPIRVEGAATLAANRLNANRHAPYFEWLIVGGVDATGGHVFALDADGGSIEDRFVSIGSGSPFVYGVLEDAGTEGLTVSEGVDLALRGLASAMRRDSASGDGSAVAEGTADGYRELGPDEVRQRLARLQLA